MSTDVVDAIICAQPKTLYIDDEFADGLIRRGVLRALYRVEDGKRIYRIPDEAARSAVYVQQLRDGLR